MPPSYYKYRAIDDDTTEGLAKNYAIDALFKCHAKLSSPSEFNDLFDCKIEITIPEPEEIIAFLKSGQCDEKHVETLRKSLSGNQDSLQDASKVLRQLNNETFKIYCLCKNSTHNLMWAHYASSHKGFCIEFEFPDPSAIRKVDYVDSLTTLPLLDFYKKRNDVDDDKMNKEFDRALKKKLRYWEYEEEYRWIDSNTTGEGFKITKDQSFAKYQPSWVKSIIFGRRMSSRSKQFIINNLPFRTEFKQAIEARESIEIEPYDAEKHLHYGDSMDAAH